MTSAHSASASRLWRPIRRSAMGVVAVAALILGSSGLAVALSGPLAAPTITKFASSPASVSELGGPVTLSAKLGGASKCTLSVTPAIAGLPAKTSCTSSSYSRVVVIPDNLTTKQVTWTFTLSAAKSRTTVKHLTIKEASSTTALENHWSGPTQLDPTPGVPTGISCSSSTTCTVVDAHGYAVSQTGVPQLIDNHAITGISCVASGECVAIDDAGDASVSVSGSWTSPVAVSANSLVAVSCVNPPPSGVFCIAIDDTGTAFAYNGTDWTSGVLVDSAAEVTGLSCTSTKFCLLVDALGNFATYSSSSWSGLSDDGSVNFTGVACASSTDCVAIDSAGNVRSYASSTWGSANDIDGGNALDGISCVPDGGRESCVVVDANGNAIVDTDGSWGTAQAIASGAPLVAVACSGLTECRTVDSNGREYVWNGSLWTNQTLDALHGQFDAVSCATNLECVAVSTTGEYSVYNGSEWSALAATGASDLTAISCTGSVCVAGEANGEVIVRRGTTWSAQSALASYPITSVSCASPSFCMAVDESGEYATWNGVSWSALKNILPSEGLGFGTVSCPTTKVCLIADQWEELILWAASKAPEDHWSDVAGDDIRSVSCETASTCLAIDADGNTLRVTIETGGIAVTALPHPDNAGLEYISCSTAFFCESVDAQGSSLLYLNGVPSSEQSVTSTSALTAVGCSSNGLCAALGPNNEVYVDRVS